MTPTPVSRIATDPDSLEAFYRAHVEEVQGFVSRRVGDPATGADLTADVFLAAIDRAHTHDPALGSPRMWLYGIARSVVAMELRRSGRHARAVSRVSGRRLLEGDAYQQVVDRLDAEREARRLHRRLEALPDPLRAVLELVALDGLGVADAAEVLGISAGAARVRLHRARRRLTAAPGGDPPEDLAPRPVTVPAREETS
ncbi:RNA polymerase sigma-70 factor, ECF subfamily [Nocardioides scoriae]|uniref:RNA polymerase sigma-70 factor, ECF subfamily n=1 Tax=Nocardioides scoriae TaxID=642780 RepID=A0A1H1SWL5_9ACTN|nr:RNA polymerase sigma factor [Nocardioides scoriae]SDS52380.1 RNA polymerase sigma-70 factor, ECF subfamily [Nocardioides scoriae]